MWVMVWKTGGKGVNLGMELIMVVEATQRRNIQEIAKTLEKMGVRIKQVLKVSGVITGSSPRMSLAKLKVKGIQKVELDRVVRAS